MGDPTTCVYQFIYNVKENFDAKRTQYFIMLRMGFFINVDRYVAHVFYAW